ncbi:hypothetical protein UA32_07205 [Photobacterium angustum]|uniref:Glycosyltransferase RgtA/B/C/D-like domain-containing protein n=1 Tax=Photobacterium angustum TaxID=661 RepID=A0ABX5H2E6_PHOAN|nr:hypothetical protein [Photobacterium angustum]KJG39031.1 hypothetical protein UA32_07205 [Photobacterium angustum]PSX07379.1 hypothetical protein C0W27_15240 [Photobacterium angustum]
MNLENLIIVILFFIITYLFVFFYVRKFLFYILISHILYIAIVLYITYGLENKFLDIDDYLPYFNSFVIYFNKGDLLSFVKPHAGIYTFSYPGWLYLIDGSESFVYIRLINTCISVLIIIPLSGIYKKIYSVDMKIWQILLILLWLPFTIRLSGELGRTPISILSIILSIDLLLSDKKSLKIFGVLVAIYAIALRIPHIVLFLPFVYFYIINSVNKIKQKQRAIVYPIVLVVFIFAFIAMVYVYYNYAGESRSFQSLEDVAEYSQARGYGNSAYLTSVEITSPLSLIYYIPLHALYFNYSPMIWDSFSNIKLLPSSLFSLFSFFLLLVFILRFKKTSINTSKFKILVLSFILTIVAFGVVTKNAGSAERWRMPLTLLSICLLSHTIRRDYGELSKL